MSPPSEKKDLALSYALWCLSLVGVCGVQRFYIGQIGYGVLLMLTFGLCGFGQLLDLLLLPTAVGNVNSVNGFGDLPASAAVPEPPSFRTSSSTTVVHPPAKPASQGADDLDALLREAKRSVERTQL